MELLSEKSFDFLIENFNSSLNNKNQYANEIIKKAKKERNQEMLIVGFDLKSTTFNNEQKLIYLDSIINLTKNKSNKYQPSSSYLGKGIFYYNIRDFKSALNNFIKAREFALKHENQVFIFKSNYNIGILKNRLGDNIGALSLLKKNLKKTSELPFVDNHEMFNSIFALATVYNEINVLDSATYYNNYGYKKSIQLKSQKFENYFRLNEGVNLFHKKKYISALDSLKKTIPILKNVNDKPNLAVAYFYKAKVFFEIEREDDAILNLKKVDTIFRETNDLHPKIRETYEILQKSR